MQENDGQQGYAPGSFLSPELTGTFAREEGTYSEIPSGLNNNNSTAFSNKEPSMYMLGFSRLVPL